MNRKTELFNQSRSELINIAYGMLGSWADARDIVQDAYLRWSGVELADISHPGAYLKTIVSRLCIDQFRSAKHQREEYVGPWLPQPVVESTGPLPNRDIELHDELTIALLHVLETLSPDQRAIYLLHDVFDYQFSEIAELLEKKPAACRKAAQRARQKIRQNKPAETVSSKQSREVVEAFIEALRGRDIDKLQRLLTDDAVLYSDGGGEVVAAPKPIESMKKVSKFLISIAEKDRKKVSVELTMVNNRPGFKAFMGGELHSVWAFNIDNGKITDLYVVLNLSKLGANGN